MLLKVSGIRNERNPLQSGEAGAQHEQDAKGVRIPPSPSDLEGEAKEAPWLGPRGSLAISVLPSSVTRGFGRTWDIRLGAALDRVSPSPELVGLCGAWNPAVIRTCGPGELAGWGQVRVGEREGPRTGQGWG